MRRHSAIPGSPQPSPLTLLEVTAGYLLVEGSVQLARDGDNSLVVPDTSRLHQCFFRDYKDAGAFVFVNAMDPVSEDGTTLNASVIDFDSMASSCGLIPERIR